jgi:hypothetical protein
MLGNTAEQLSSLRTCRNSSTTFSAATRSEASSCLFLVSV